MRQARTFWRGLGAFLIEPVYPRFALSITESQLVLLSLRYQQQEFSLRQVATTSLPVGMLEAGFVRPNIFEEDHFCQLLGRLPEEAGVKNLRRLSVSLPATSARSYVVTLDAEPRSRAEAAQLLDWKIERVSGYPTDELQISRMALPAIDGRTHWLVSVVHRSVLGQYEALFARLGWEVGLIVPRHLAEVLWLTRASTEGDQMLVSPTRQGVEVVILRGSHPILIRELDCSEEEMANEFYRLVIFYRDRLISEGGASSLFRLLVMGSAADQQRYRDLVGAALERPVVALTPAQLGLRLEPGMAFSQVGSAAGLASCAWPA
jgi:Tfp pilus assembly PilM family ATPase